MPWHITGRIHAMADSQTAGAYGRFHAAMPWQIPRRQELMADSMLPYHGGLLDAGAYGGSEDRPMADHRRQAHGRLPCSTRIGLSLGLHIVSAPEPP
jgi:hypothetical protein